MKLTVVAAPAGCGKTTLLGTWRDAEAAVKPVAWLTIDEGDNDPVVLWSHLLEALRRAAPDLGTSLPESVGAPRSVEVVARQLVNGLDEHGEIALILDDFHRLSNGAARDSMAWLIEHAPPTFHLVLASRSEPGLALGAMRAHGDLMELRAGDLGFSSSEANELLNGRLDLGLSMGDIDRLVERIEGWPAGVYLAGLSLAGVDDRHAFVSGFDGGSRAVVDFLVDEVVDAYDPSLQALMLGSSILDRFSGSLCDAVLEREDSAKLLAELSRTNLFLLPLDDDGEWYRFHHLFAQLLRVELEHRKPGSAPTLYRRAYAWHRDHGTPDEAIRYAQRGEAFAEAAEATLEASFWTGGEGGHATVIAWLDGFPSGLVLEDPRLLLTRAWMCSQAGMRGEAAAAMAALDGVTWPDGELLPDGSTSLETSLATLRAAYPWGDVGAAYRNALRAIDYQSRETVLWPRAAWSFGVACYYKGDLALADRWLDEAVEAGPVNGRWLVTASGLAYRSLVAGERGHRDDQQRLAEEAADVAEAHRLEEIRGEVHVAMGVALAAHGSLDDALPYLDRGVDVLRSGQPLDFALALLRLAEVLKALNRRTAAASAIAEAAATIADCPDPGRLVEQLQAVRQSHQAGRRETALSERELVVLRMLNGPLSERDIGRELYLSHNTIHTHTRSIYRKLGASSRKQAIAHAVRLGIL
jgi:ATP/maltotriose-dependent transcriptional regulator MalT